MIGGAALLLWFDIVPEHVAEHDEWHTREHFPERVGIPGFLRAQRWKAPGPSSSSYFVSYSVRDVDVLTSPAYGARLNHPSEWTRRMMPHYRNMIRGFCALEHRFGSALGADVLSIRYQADPAQRDALKAWIAGDRLPAIAQRRGVASAFALVAAAEPPMTSEQAIRGRDATVDSVILVSCYEPTLVDEVREDALAAHMLEARGAMPGIAYGHYRLACRADATLGTTD